MRRDQRGQAEGSERAQQAARSVRFYSENLREIGANFAESGFGHMFVHEGSGKLVQTLATALDNVFGDFAGAERDVPNGIT